MQLIDPITVQNLSGIVSVFALIMFFVPGFISIKVYDLFVATDNRDFSKSSLFEAIAYSSLNYALVLPIGYYVFHILESSLNIVTIVGSFSLISLFFTPAIWGALSAYAPQYWPLKRILDHPAKKPWDYVFSKREPYWILIHLKNGGRIGGKYGRDSFASSYPADEQIYLQEVWEIDENGQFLEPIEDSKGVIVSAEDIELIEFLGR